MSTVLVHQEVGVHDAQRALTDSLGPHYRIEPAGGSTLKVKRNAAIWSTVRLTPAGGDTKIQVNSGGLVLLRGINAVAITPKVRQALEHAFPAP